MQTEVRDHILRAELENYKSGEFGDSELTQKTKKNRRLFCEGMERYFDAHGWIWNEQASRNYINYKKNLVLHNGKKPQANSVRNYIAVIRAFTEFLIKRGHLQKNFCQWIAKPKEEIKIIDPRLLDVTILKQAIELGTRPTWTDRRSVFTKAESFDALNFMLDTGRRKGEVLKLKGSDIHFEAENPFYIAVLKGGQRRQFPIPKSVVPILKKRRHKDKVFEVSGEAMIGHVRRGLKALHIEADVTADWVNHTFRKAFARERNRNGESIQRIAQSLANSVEVCERYYLGYDYTSIESTVNNSRTIQHGLALIDIFDEIEKFVRIKTEDNRVETPRAGWENGEFVIRIKPSLIGERELANNRR